MIMPVVDGKTTKVNYFSFSSDVLNRTSSQTCGRWYLPTFLFRDGSLILMYRAPLIVFIRFRSCLPTMPKLLMVTSCPVMLLWSYMGEGLSDVLWTFLQKFLRTLQCTFYHTPPCHIGIYRWLPLSLGPAEARSNLSKACLWMKFSPATEKIYPIHI